MADENGGLSPAFVARQRQRLEALRDELSRKEENTEAEARALQENYGGEPGDAGDAGADIAQREVNQALHDVGDRRLADMERALEKITEGSYGLSDASGEPIPKARLEVMPEAVCTVEEERVHEAGR